MKILFLSLFLAGAAFAQTTIATFTLTKADCSPTSMTMLFRPQGFVCVPSTTVLVTGGAEAYQVEVEFMHANGQWATERTFIKVDEFGQAKWISYEEGIKVRKVTAVPQSAGVPVTTIF